MQKFVKKLWKDGGVVKRCHKTVQSFVECLWKSVSNYFKTSLDLYELNYWLTERLVSRKTMNRSSHQRCSVKKVFKNIYFEERPTDYFWIQYLHLLSNCDNILKVKATKNAKILLILIQAILNCAFHWNVYIYFLQTINSEIFSSTK